MTNEEALKIIDKEWPKVSYNHGAQQTAQNLYGNGLGQSSYRPPMTPETFIKLAVALGMLKLDEPPKVSVLLDEADEWSRAGGFVEVSNESLCKAIKLISKMRLALWELSR